MTAPSTTAGRALRATDPALAEYGIHHWDACNGLVDDYWLKCDCGLVQAILAIEAEAAAQALADAVDIEAIAAIEHVQWMAWSQSLADSEALAADRVERWRAMWVPYEQLPEDVKEFDRIWAREVMRVLGIAAAPASPEPEVEG